MCQHSNRQFSFNAKVKKPNTSLDWAYYLHKENIILIAIEITYKTFVFGIVAFHLEHRIRVVSSFKFFFCSKSDERQATRNVRQWSVINGSQPSHCFHCCFVCAFEKHLLKNECKYSRFCKHTNHVHIESIIKYCVPFNNSQRIELHYNVFRALKCHPLCCNGDG